MSAGIGDNRPPPEYILRADELTANANRWIKERPKIEDESQSEAAQGFIEQLRPAIADLKAAMAAEKKPHNDALDAIGARFKTPIDALELALQILRDKATAWLQHTKAIADRAAAEQKAEADRKRAEADAAAAKLEKGDATIEQRLEAGRLEKQATTAEKTAAKPTPPPAIRGEYGTRSMGLRTYWHARLKIPDNALLKERDAAITLVLRHYARDRAARELMLEACLRVAKAEAGRVKRVDAAPPGLEFFTKQTAT